MTSLLCAFALLASDAWVLVRDEQRVTMSGDLANLRTAQKYLKKFGPKFLWFRHGNKQYIVRDGDVFKQAEAVAQGDGETDAEEAQLDQADQELEHHQKKLDRHQAALERWEDHGDQEKLHRAQEDLNRAQEQINREQEKVGKQQEKLGRAEEKRAKEMERQMDALIAAALKNGTAKEVK
jgi:hypothetical protein